MATSFTYFILQFKYWALLGLFYSGYRTTMTQWVKNIGTVDIELQYYTVNTDGYISGNYKPLLQNCWLTLLDEWATDVMGHLFILLGGRFGRLFNNTITTPTRLSGVLTSTVFCTTSTTIHYTTQLQYTAGGSTGHQITPLLLVSGLYYLFSACSAAVLRTALLFRPLFALPLLKSRPRQSAQPLVEVNQAILAWSF